jgi:hypothetical protein
MCRAGNMGQEAWAGKHDFIGKFTLKNALIIALAIESHGTGLEMNLAGITLNRQNLY